MDQDYTHKTKEELVVIARALRTENERLREERNAQALELKQHVVRFSELREKFAVLRNEVDLLVKRTEKD